MGKHTENPLSVARMTGVPRCGPRDPAGAVYSAPRRRDGLGVGGTRRQCGEDPGQVIGFLETRDGQGRTSRPHRCGIFPGAGTRDALCASSP